MAQKIKGITIEIGGDTTNLGKALESVNRKSRELKSELQGVNSMLKLDPSNVELLKQKQDILNQSIAVTREKLDKLKEAQVKVQEQFDKGEITEEQYRDFQREIVATEGKIKSLTNELKNFGSIGQQQIEAVSTKMKETGGKLEDAGKKMLGTTAVITGLETASIAVSSNFDTAMKQVAATMGITTDDIKKGSKSYEILENAAKQCGETTKYSASESAEALNYLALAGYSAEQSAAVLPKVLNLAAAGGLDLAQASDMVTDAMAALGMETSDLDKYIDQMAKTSQKSNTSVAQLGEATLTVAGTAKMSNMSLETMNTSLGILANNGIKGAEGGTHLRNIILSLTSPTDKAAEALKTLGINVLDSQGNVRDLNDIMTDFNAKLDGLSDGKKTEIISSIFNKTDISAVNALIKGSGDEFSNLKMQLENCDGAAQDMADTMNSSFSGQLTLLKSQIEALAIKISAILMPILLKIVNKISDFITWLGNLNPAVLKIVVVIASLIAALGPVLIYIGKIINAVGDITKIIPKLLTVLNSVKSTISKLFTLLMHNPISITIAAIASLVAGFIYLWNNCESFRNFWINLWSNIQNICKNVIDGILDFFSNIIDFIKNNWQEILLFIINPFVGAFKLIYDNCESFKNFIDEIIQKIKSIFEGIVLFIKENVIEPIKNFFAPSAAWFAELFSNIFNSLKSIIEVCWGIIQGLWQLISALFLLAVSWINEKVINPVQNAFHAAIEWIKNAIQLAWEFVVSIFSVIANWLKQNVINPIMNILKSLLDFIKNTIIYPIQNAFSSAWQVLTNGAANAWNSIKNIFSSVATFFGDIFSKAWQKVKNVFSSGGKIFEGIKDSISSVFRDVVNKLIDGINTVVAIPFNAINKMLNKIRNIEILGLEPFKNKWSENPLKVPQIPHMRTGGTIVGDGNAIMAEAGSPELIQMMNGKTVVRPLTSIERKQVISNTTNNGNNTFNFYSPKALSPSESRRQFRKEMQFEKLLHG